MGISSIAASLSSIKDRILLQGVFSCGQLTTKVTMKFLIVFLACLGLSCAALRDDLLDLVSTVPIDEWKAVSARFREGDTQYGDVLRYLRGESGDWSGFVGRVKDNAEWQEFKAWMLERGVDLQVVVDRIHEAIANAEPGAGGNMGGVRALVDECLKYFSMDDVAAKLDELLTNSPDFLECFVEISSPEARAFLEDFMFADSEFQFLVGRLTEFGIDVQYLKQIIYDILGWA